MSIPNHFAFLIRRPNDREAWATIFTDRNRAEAYEHRASQVVPLTLTEGDAVETPSVHNTVCPVCETVHDLPPCPPGVVCAESVKDPDADGGIDISGIQPVYETAGDPTSPIVAHCLMHQFNQRLYAFELTCGHLAVLTERMYRLRQEDHRPLFCNICGGANHFAAPPSASEGAVP